MSTVIDFLPTLKVKIKANTIEAQLAPVTPSAPPLPQFVARILVWGWAS